MDALHNRGKTEFKVWCESIFSLKTTYLRSHSANKYQRWLRNLFTPNGPNSYFVNQWIKYEANDRGRSSCKMTRDKCCHGKSMISPAEIKVNAVALAQNKVNAINGKPMYFKSHNPGNKKNEKYNQIIALEIA